jgi:hypothetical protein
MSSIKNVKGNVLMGHHPTLSTGAGTWRFKPGGGYIVDLPNTKIIRASRQDIVSLYQMIVSLEQQHPGRNVKVILRDNGGAITGLPRKDIPIVCKNGLYYVKNMERTRMSRRRSNRKRTNFTANVDSHGEVPELDDDQLRKTFEQ